MYDTSSNDNDFVSKGNYSNYHENDGNILIAMAIMGSKTRQS